MVAVLVVSYLMKADSASTRAKRGPRLVLIKSQVELVYKYCDTLI
jgi:hypothetical protein